MEIIDYLKDLLGDRPGKRFEKAKFISDYLGMVSRFVLLLGLLVFMQFDSRFSEPLSRIPIVYQDILRLSPLVFMAPLALCLFVFPTAQAISELYNLFSIPVGKIRIIFRIIAVNIVICVDWLRKFKVFFWVFWTIKAVYDVLVWLLQKIRPVLTWFGHLAALFFYIAWIVAIFALLFCIIIITREGVT